jgi:hypothetical protein
MQEGQSWVFKGTFWCLVSLKLRESVYILVVVRGNSQ